MRVDIDQAKLDEAVRWALLQQEPHVREQLLELLEIHDVKVWTGKGARDEEWILTVDGNPLAKVHRSRLEVAPGAST